MKKILLFILFISFFNGGTIAYAFNPTKDIVTFRKYVNIGQLKNAADLIGYGDIHGVEKQFKTPHTVDHGTLVNYVQRFQIEQAYKGPRQTVSVLITGVKPLPRPQDPLNQLYPGPLANGQYIFFLHKIAGTTYYQFTGGWQGVYPMIEGKSVTLYGEGFAELNQLTAKQFDEKIR